MVFTEELETLRLFRENNERKSLDVVKIWESTLYHHNLDYLGIESML